MKKKNYDWHRMGQLQYSELQYSVHTTYILAAALFINSTLLFSVTQWAEYKLIHVQTIQPCHVLYHVSCALTRDVPFADWNKNILVSIQWLLHLLYFPVINQETERMARPKKLDGRPDSYFYFVDFRMEFFRNVKLFSRPCLFQPEFRLNWHLGVTGMHNDDRGLQWSARGHSAPPFYAVIQRGQTERSFHAVSRPSSDRIEQATCREIKLTRINWLKRSRIGAEFSLDASRTSRPAQNWCRIFVLSGWRLPTPRGPSWFDKIRTDFIFYNVE